MATQSLCTQTRLFLLWNEAPKISKALLHHALSLGSLELYLYDGNNLLVFASMAMTCLRFRKHLTATRLQVYGKNNTCLMYLLCSGRSTLRRILEQYDTIGRKIALEDPVSYFALAATSHNLSRLNPSKYIGDNGNNSIFLIVSICP